MNKNDWTEKYEGSCNSDWEGNEDPCDGCNGCDGYWEQLAEEQADILEFVGNLRAQGYTEESAWNTAEAWLGLSLREDDLRDEDMEKVIIYADGSCLGNPGMCGWAARLIYGEHMKNIGGPLGIGTNNRAELAAVIMALRALKKPCVVEVRTDSNYVVSAFNAGWVDSWLSNGWRNAAKKPVANRDLWEALLKETTKHKTTFLWVKGHDTDPHNLAVDQAARNFAGKEV